jgi:AraC family transcriptional regulator, regulatory protein of adaptative response / DNA-3-methyladenine glycosylase II
MSESLELRGALSRTLWPTADGLAEEESFRPVALPSFVELRLFYHPPLAWRQLLAWLKARATRGVEVVFDTGYARTVQIEDARGWMEVQSLAQDNALCLRAPPALSPVLFPLVQHVRKLFDLDADPQEIAGHLQQDELLRPMVERHPGLRIPGAWSVFELGLRAILGQQVSVAAATTLAGRLAARFGWPLDASRHGLTHLTPTPERLSALEPRELAKIGLPLARAETLRAWAGHAVDGDLHFALGTPLETAVRHLREIPGVGEWTAHYVALRALRYPDAFPATDLGFAQGRRLRSPAGSHRTLPRLASLARLCRHVPLAVPLRFNPYKIGSITLKTPR